VTAAGAVAALLVVSGCSRVDQADPTVIGAVCLSHDGDWGVPDPALCLLDLDSADRTVIVDDIASAEPIALSPDRTRMAYTDGDSKLAVVSVTPPHGPKVIVDSTLQPQSGYPTPRSVL